MTPDQQRLAFALALVPGRGRAVSPEEFRERAGVADPSEWALEQLRSAVRHEDGDAAEAALVVGAVFGRDRRWSECYVHLLESDWHVLHEGAAAALGQYGGAEAVPALVRAAHRVPQYLEFDEARALAVKAIHSLSRIPGLEAEAALRDLLEHEDHELRARVRRVLDRRLQGPLPPR